jgi:anti-sigma B factor antagonist
MTTSTDGIHVSVQTVSFVTVTVSITGRLDAVVCPALRVEFDTRIAAGCQHLVADLSAASFVDSVGLAALVKAMRDAQSAGATFEILRPSSEDAMRVFRLSKFDEVFVMKDKPS